MIETNFKYTELGLIPHDWEVKELGEIVTFRDSERIPIKEIDRKKMNGQYPYYGASGIIDYINKYIFDDELILLGEDGANIINRSSRLAFIVKGKCWINNHAHVLKPLPDICIGFLVEMLESFSYDQYNTGTAQPKLNREKCNHILIPLPPTLAEQEKIADALSKIDILISDLRALIEKKKAIKQGAMQQLLTGKKRLKGFTEEWVEKSIEELGVLTGAGVDKKSYKDETPIRLVNYTDIFKRDYIYQNELDFWVTANEGKKNQCNVLKGDIFFTPSSEMPYDIALSALAMEDMPDVCYSYHVYRLRLNEDIDFLYRAYMFKSNAFYSQANQTCEGSGKRYVISLSKFKQMVVTYPSCKKEQHAIANILSSMDTEITNLEQKRDKYIAIKQGVMKKLLTGQIRLTKPQTSIQPLLPNVIAGHIVNTLYQSQGWGRTKLQKALHLSSYYSQADLGACYIRNTAGPDDQSFMNQIDLKFKQYHHIEVFPNITLDGKKHYVYRPTEDIHILEKVYDGYPKIIRQKIDFILSKMSSWDLAQSEIISTLYAVWNNRIIKNLPISDELLLADFYKWSKHKSEYSSDKVLKMLDYMRKENIIPIGWGKYIEDREDW